MLRNFMSTYANPFGLQMFRHFLTYMHRSWTSFKVALVHAFGHGVCRSANLRNESWKYSKQIVSLWDSCGFFRDISDILFVKSLRFFFFGYIRIFFWFSKKMFDFHFFMNFLPKKSVISAIYLNFPQ